MTTIDHDLDVRAGVLEMRHTESGRADIDDSDFDDAGGDNSPADRNIRFATFLRWGGAGAVGVSGLIYLLQGIGDIDGEIRNWIYVGLMAVLAGGGLVSQLTLKDAKGARLFFTLAAAIIPVQFAQLAGMIHVLLTVDDATRAAVFASMTPSSTMMVAAVTALLSVPVAYAAFSVLVRGQALRLTLAFTAINAITLYPERDSALGLGMVAILVVAAVILERRYFAAEAASPAFRTVEGGAVRVMFLLPLIIAAVRLALEVEALWGYCALGAMAGTALLFGSTWTRNRLLSEITSFAGTWAIGLSWLIFAQDVIGNSDRVIAYPVVTAFAPLALFLFVAAERSSFYAHFYRGAATLVLTALSIQVVVADYALTTAFALVPAGVLLAAWGFFRKHREPLIGGVIVTTIGTGAAIAFSIEHITASSWLLFAGLGVALVLISSVIERYGKGVVRSTLDGWSTVRTWK